MANLNENTPDFSISDLRIVPDFAATAADRVWNAWWRSKGVALDYISGRVQENFSSTGIPLALIAHDEERFMGTASLIASDMHARPHYAPWVAAVWVDADYRGTGVGSALVKAAAQAAFAQGVDTVYLCATPTNAPFYERMGWLRIEANVDGLDIFALSQKSLPLI